MTPVVMHLWDATVFPTLETTAIYTNTDDTLLAKTMTLPTGIASGDVTVVFFSTQFTDVTHTPEAGWTLLASASDGGNGRGSVYWKVCDGTETTFTVTLDYGRRASATMYRFSNADLAEGSIIAGLDSPSLSPAGGSAKNIWITATMGRRTDYVLTPPSGYAGQLTADNYPPDTTNTGYGVAASAHRELEAATEDPGAWVCTPANISAPVSATVAVRGAA